MSEHQSSQEWLKEHGLEANGLGLCQILSSLGFQQCSGGVECLGRSVTSQYGIGLFLQHPDDTGHVYNLVSADEQRLGYMEMKLTAAISSLKNRLEWLTAERCFASCEGLPPTDVLEIQSELEKARDTLAQVQALHMEVGEKARAYHYDRKVVTASKRHSQQKSSKTKVSSDWKRAEARTITIQRNSPTQNPAPRTANTKSMGKPTILANSRHLRHNLSSPPKIHTTAGQPRPTGKPMVGLVKGSKVLACSKSDGFYYRGVVAGGVSRDSALIQFPDRKEQDTSLSQLVVVGGACPQPHLRPHDYVLCCVRMTHGEHSTIYGVCDSYIPAQVQVVPSSPLGGPFSVTAFDGDHLLSTRSGLVKISESRYKAISGQLGKNPPNLDEDVMPEEVVSAPFMTEQFSINSPDSPASRSKTASVCFGSEVSPVTSYHSTPEKSDKETSTEPVETEEKGISVWISTQERAVNTGPQMVDQWTITRSPEHCNLTLEDEIDSAEPAEWEVGTPVFCCWPQTCYYSEASLLDRSSSLSSWTVKTEAGDVVEVPTSHIIRSSDNNSVFEGATVLASHPLFQAGFAPGTITGIDTQSSVSYNIKFYDGLQTAGGKVQLLSQAEHKAAVSLLQEKCKRWVGQTVIARRERDGVYYPAVVKELLARHCYRVQWADGTQQRQSMLHMFGPLSVRRSLQAGDHVLALAMPGIGACLPGTLTGTGTGTDAVVEVKFSDGERQMVSKEQCFWISTTYFLSAVEFISASFSI